MTEVNENDLKRTENYLKGYKFNKKLLSLKSYEDRYLGSREREKDAPDMHLALVKSHQIRHFIMDMKNSDEKLFLYYHFIRLETTERCAELFGISRSSAFRLKKRALEVAFKELKRKNKLDWLE